jgi:membrane-associated phospholipid phosphatase
VLVTVDVLAGGPLSRLDGRVSDLVRSDARWLDLLLVLGDRFVVVPVVLVWLAVVARRRRSRQPLVRLAVLGLATAVTVYALKAGIAREPPPGLLSTGPPRSYPSGHTATAVVLWGLLADVVRTRPTAVLARLAPAVTVLGMLLRDYHWVTDMVAAAALGVVLLQAERWALGHWRRARRRPAAAGAPAGDAAAPDPGVRG